MENILITGVTGFVGTHFVRHFRNDPKVKLFGHSRKLRVTDDVMTYLPEYGSDVLIEKKVTSFIHLAGIAHDLSNVYKPEDYYRVNLEGTRKAVDEFLKSDARHFIFVSSIKAVCDVASTAADESWKPDPQTDYGKSKRLAEEYILSLKWPADKKFYILRPAMMHGAGNKGNLNVLYKYAKSGLPFPFGAFYNQRSFHSIENFSFIIEQLLRRDIPSGVYHLADDGYLSATQLYELICEALHVTPRVWKIKAQWIETLASLMGKRQMVSKLTENMMVSNKKIVNALGEPLHLSLIDGLIKTIMAFDGK